MATLDQSDRLTTEVVAVIHAGDTTRLGNLLAEHPELATVRIVDTARHADEGRGRSSRSLLHVVADWPGHFPNGAETVALLVAAGADVDAPFVGAHAETALHWAASSDDVDVLDALLDAGADIEAPGSVVDGGTPLADAVAFGQWRAARRLVERGAATTLWQAAALGLMDRVHARFEVDPEPTTDDVNVAFWSACHGGQQRTAAYLLERGAELNWLPNWGEALTPLDAARRSEAYDVLTWLHGLRAKSADQLHLAG